MLLCTKYVKTLEFVEYLEGLKMILEERPVGDFASRIEAFKGAVGISEFLSEDEELFRRVAIAGLLENEVLTGTGAEVVYAKEEGNIACIELVLECQVPKDPAKRDWKSYQTRTREIISREVKKYTSMLDATTRDKS